MPRKRTRFEDLETAGRELTDAEVQDQLRMLARDERFAAVVAWLARSEAAWRLDVAGHANGEKQGHLAASAGGMGACLRLQAQLRSIVDKARSAPSASPAD